MRKNLSALLLSSFVLSSCVSTTIIRSEEPGVKVYADGAYIGTAPAIYSDTKIVGSSTTFMLKKEGCLERTYTIHRSEEFQPGPCIGGLFVFVPYLWIMGYKPERTFAFECEPKKAI